MCLFQSLYYKSIRNMSIRHKGYLKQCYSLFAVFFMLIITCECGTGYRQSLTILEDKMIRLQFETIPQLLPIPLRTVYEEFHAQIYIQYGPYFHQYSKGLWANTITTRLRFNETRNDGDLQIPEKLKQILIASFAISVADRYGCYLKQTQTLVFNDPNDKFCGHHIEQIVTNFLPCASNSGISQLIDLDTMFSAGQNGMRLYGMKVAWDGKGMEVSIYVPLGKIEGIKKIKVNQKCLTDSELTMTDFRHEIITLKQIVLNRLQQSFIGSGDQRIQIPRMKVRRDLLGNWYNPHKILQITVQVQKYLNNSILVIRELLPSRAGVKKINIQNSKENNGIQMSYECRYLKNQRQIKYKTPSTLCEISIRLSSQEFQQQQLNFFQIRLQMENKMICFDNFEAIFGGGAELPNIPIIFIEPNQAENISYIYSGPVSLRTPEPDQSLPFQVITFTLGIFGYLWLSIWRKLVSDVQKNEKAKKI